MLHFGKLKWGAAYVGTLLAFLIFLPRTAGPANYDIDSEPENVPVQTTPTDPEALQRERQECEKATRTFVVTKDGEPRIAPYTIIDDETVVEGDIVVGDAAAAHEPVINVVSYKWPGGIVPFEIDQSSFSSGDQPQRIRDAMEEWEKARVVHFKQKDDNDPNFIVFKNMGDACQSRIGMRGGRQLVEIGPRCKYHHILHEIGHVLGLLHEQSRSDRNQHVKVLWDHIKPEERKQFCRVLYRKNPLAGDISNRYDFGSIMHYRLDAFSTCSPGSLTESCKTLVPINQDELRASGIKEAEVGTRSTVSDEDLQAIRVIYGGSQRPPPPEPSAHEGSSTPIIINKPRGPIIVKNSEPIKVYQSANGGRIWRPARRRPHVHMNDCCGCCYPRMSWCQWRRAPVLHYSDGEEYVWAR
jgi:hypothetical protein